MVTTQMIVTLLIGVVIPALVSLITRSSTDARVKAIFTALLSAVAGVAQGFLDTPPDQVWQWQVAVFYGIVTFITAISTYFGLLRPTGAADVLQRTLVKDPVVLPEDPHAPVWVPPVSDGASLPDPNTYTAD
jgi:hypothetical protein